jgi:prepilin-type processing-associated H-X9-DG protein
MNRILAIVILAVVLAAPAIAQPLADRVPADALVYIGWRGSENLPASYDESHLKAVIENSKFRELFTDLLPQIIQKVGSPHELADLLGMQEIGAELWRHPTAFYFAGIDMSNPSQPMPKLAIVCQAGNDAAVMQQDIMNLIAKAGHPPINVFVEKDMLIVAVGYYQVADTMTTAATSLQQAPPFAAAMKQVQADPVMIAYANVESITSLFEAAVQANNPPAAQKAGKVIDALGLRGLKRVIHTCGFDGKEWLSQTFVEAPSPRSGLLTMLDPAPVSPELVKTIPSDSTFAVATRFDAAKLIQTIRDGAGQVDPQAQRMIDQILGMVQVAIAKNPLTDVLQPLGQDWAMYCSPSVAGNGVLGIVVVNHLKDPAKAEASLPTASINLSNWAAVAMSRADAKVQITQKTISVDGNTIYYLALPVVAPSWMIKDGNLYMGLYPESVIAAARWSSHGGKSIAENEKFVALQKRLGANSPCGFSFFDLPTTAAQGSSYEQLLALTQYGGVADLFGLTLPEPLLPTLDVLQQNVTPAGSTAWVDDAGYHQKSLSPFPGSTLLSEPGMMTSTGPGASALMLAVLLPATNRARETANRVKCASNMRQIGQGILLYANDHKGKYPDNLGQLVVAEDLTAQVFVCPSGSKNVPMDIIRAPKDQQGDWVNQHSDYIYLGAGKKNSIAADVITLYEKSQDHGNAGMNLLFGDGHVEFMTMPVAWKMLQDQGAGNVAP